CLVEDAEAYEFFRGAFTSFDSHRTTFRRLYANGRGVQDLSGGYVSTCPGGDYGIEAFSTGETLVEDCIVENICNTGFTNLTAPSVTGDTGIGDDSRFIADIALGPGAGGFEIYSVCDATSPCDTPDRIASRNQIIESAAFNFDTDFAAFGEESVLRNVSAIDATNNGFYFDVRTPPGGLVASVSLTAGLVVGTTIGVLEANQATWSVDYTNVWSAGTAFSPNDSHVTNASMIDPQIGICNVYLAPGSPMRGAGPNGTNIGADIRVQYRDGVATTDPYWRANGVFAGCGGVIAGLNDDPSTSCIGVHTRLHVGTAGCAWP
ncbi:MAG TPA: hypothetical protein VL326_18695, partial [Kofleriaceae bacterium]|nr:hypothetical protein [Kofleriaceae bacterium]